MSFFEIEHNKINGHFWLLLFLFSNWMVAVLSFFYFVILVSFPFCFLFASLFFPLFLPFLSSFCLSFNNNMIALAHTSLEFCTGYFYGDCTQTSGEKIKDETIITWLIVSEDLVGPGWLGRASWQWKHSLKRDLTPQTRNSESHRQGWGIQNLYIHLVLPGSKDQTSNLPKKEI